MKYLLFLSGLLFLVSCGAKVEVGVEEAEEKLEIPDSLYGIEMQYIYDNGTEFAIRYRQEGVTYQYKNGSRPKKWWGPYKYNYLMTESGEHYLSWFEAHRGDYVTQLINFDQKILYGSAILGPKQKVFFHKAEIIRLELP